MRMIKNWLIRCLIKHTDLTAPTIYTMCRKVPIAEMRVYVNEMEKVKNVNPMKMNDEDFIDWVYNLLTDEVYSRLYDLLN